MRDGYRIGSHTADLIIEAWGETRARCFEQAARALVASFAEIEPCDSARHVVEVAPDEDDAMLVALLEEIIYLLDARRAIAAIRRIDEQRAGGLAATFDLLPVARAVVVGAAPKAIAYHALSVSAGCGGWRCRVTVDV